MVPYTSPRTPHNLSLWPALYKKFSLSAALLTLGTLALTSDLAFAKYTFYKENELLYYTSDQQEHPRLLSAAGECQLPGLEEVTVDHQQALKFHCNANTEIVLKNLTVAQISGQLQSIELENATIETSDNFHVAKFTTRGHSNVGQGRYTVTGQFSILEKAVFQAAANLRFFFDQINNQGKIYTDVEKLTIKLTKELAMGEVEAQNLYLTLQEDRFWQDVLTPTVQALFVYSSSSGQYEPITLEEDEDSTSTEFIEPYDAEFDKRWEAAHKDYDQTEFNTLDGRYKEIIRSLENLDAPSRFVLYTILDKEFKEVDLDEPFVANDKGIIKYVIKWVQGTTDPRARKGWLSLALEAENFEEAIEIWDDLEKSNEVADGTRAGLRLILARAKKVLDANLIAERLYEFLKTHYTSALQVIKNHSGEKISDFDAFKKLVLQASETES